MAVGGAGAGVLAVGRVTIYLTMIAFSGTTRTPGIRTMRESGGEAPNGWTGKPPAGAGESRVSVQLLDWPTPNVIGVPGAGVDPSGLRQTKPTVFVGKTPTWIVTVFCALRAAALRIRIDNLRIVCRL